MSWSFTAPPAIEAILAACEAADSLAGVYVQDGPIVINDAAQEALCIGLQSEENPMSVEAELSLEGYSVGPVREQYTILNAANVQDGEMNIARARTRAYVLAAAVGAILDADKTLGGVVMMAHLGAVNLRQQQTAKGALAIVEFGINVQAFTIR